MSGQISVSCVVLDSQHFPSSPVNILHCFICSAGDLEAPWHQGFSLAGCFDFIVRLWLLFIRQIVFIEDESSKPQTSAQCGALGEPWGLADEGESRGTDSAGGSWEICLRRSWRACQPKAARSCLKSPDQYQVDLPHDFPNQAKTTHLYILEHFQNGLQCAFCSLCCGLKRALSLTDESSAGKGWLSKAVGTVCCGAKRL